MYTRGPVLRNDALQSAESRAGLDNLRETPLRRVLFLFFFLSFTFRHARYIQIQLLS